MQHFQQGTLEEDIYTGSLFSGVSRVPKVTRHHLAISHQHKFVILFRPAWITECPWSCQTPRTLFQKHRRETIKKVKNSDSQEHQVQSQPFQIWKKEAGQILPLHSQWKTKNQRQPASSEALTAPGHTVQIPLKQQEKTLRRCCNDSWSFASL